MKYNNITLLNAILLGYYKNVLDGLSSYIDLVDLLKQTKHMHDNPFNIKPTSLSNACELFLGIVANICIYINRI